NRVMRRMETGYSRSCSTSSGFVREGPRLLWGVWVAIRHLLTTLLRLPHYVVTGQCGILVAVDTFDDTARLLMDVERRIRRARHRHRHECAELRLSDLARRLRIAPRSATEVVDALCERGLVEREPSSTDRRATSLVLTAKGRGILTDVNNASPATEVFAPLSP